MKTFTMLVLVGSLGGCVSFATQMQRQGCRLVLSDGARTAYNPSSGQMWIAPGRNCYECPQYRTRAQAEAGDRPTYTVCR